MHRFILALAALAMLGSTAPSAHADDHPAITPLTVGDGVALLLFAELGGGLAGGGGGVLFALPLVGSDYDTAMAVGTVAGTVSGSFGAAYAMHLYGRARGLGGSFWAGVAGAAVGSALAFVASGRVSFDSDDIDRTFIVWGTLPAVGAAAGYILSCALNDGPAEEAPPTGALLDLSRDEGLRVGVPSVGVAPGGDGDTVLHLGLVGGRF